jgi:lipopolysaccharide transport system permease protein/teichoic acid transport system permease protein
MLLYYYAAMCTFVLGLGWALSALNVFSRDISQGVTAILNLWFWLTPIAWVSNLIPARYAWIVERNPMYFVVDGYRNVVLYAGGLFDNAVGHLYFWSIAIGCFMLGYAVFRRLKPDFPDVL